MASRPLLSTAQSKIVDHGEGPLLVLAGPGSGKTRALTERIAKLLSYPDTSYHVLALTFTNRAANEMRQRLSDVRDIEKRSFIGTIHSFCIQVLADRGGSLGFHGVPAIFNSPADRKLVLQQAVSADPELAQALQEAGDTKAQAKRIDDWLRTINLFKAHPLSKPYRNDDFAGRLVEAYDAALAANNAIDFDGALLLAHRLFLERPAIADFYRRLYKYVCVDEAQDLNELQYAVICAFCGSSFKNLVMVGDPAQSIYGFNTSDPKFMERFQSEFGARRLDLRENYRSSRTVVSLAQKLDPKFEIQGLLPIEGSCALISGDDEQGEAKNVVSHLVRLMASGHRDIEGEMEYARVAILGRTRYALLHVESELRQREIPFFRNVSAAVEIESKAFKQFELALRIAANPRDQFHLVQLLKLWNSSLNEAIPDDISAKGLLNLLLSAAPDEGAKTIVQATQTVIAPIDSIDLLPALADLQAFGEGMTDDQKLATLEDIAVWRNEWDLFLRSEMSSKRTLTAFLSSLALGTNQQVRRDGVALLTVHSSKGLEYDVVYIVGLIDGSFPDYRARSDPRALAEERRSMFVAVTRSKRLVHFSYSKTRRMPWGDIWQSRPSPFLSQMGLV